jgi:hypothetical protein
VTDYQLHCSLSWTDGVLADKKSSVYSDRPTMVMGTELVGWGRALALVPYGERLRSLRRLLHGKFICVYRCTRAT